MTTTYAPAKINLTLDTYGLREDGKHEILTVFQTINLFDEIEWEVNDSGKIEVFCPLHEINAQHNLVWKAAKEYFRWAGLTNKGFKANVTKNIPLMSGLGGGSSDACAIIMALAQMFEKYPPLEFYASIGSDVPYFTMQGTVLGRGVGDELTPLKPVTDVYTVVVQGSARISTANAYLVIDELKYRRPVDTQGLIDAIYTENYEKMVKYCDNVFEQAADEMGVFEVAAIKADLEMHGADCAVMTGSGSSVYGLFKDLEKAQKATNDLKKDFRFVQLCEFINPQA